MKYLGLHLDRNLKCQQVKNVSQKLTCGIKTINWLQSFLQKKKKLLVPRPLVIRRLHSSSILLTGISQNFLTTLKKQLNWALKACFQRYKLELEHLLRTRHKTSSFRYFLDFKSIYSFWKWKSTFLIFYLTFDILKLPQQTSTIKREQIKWSSILIFGVTFCGKVRSREQFFYGTSYHKHYKIRKNKCNI